MAGKGYRALVACILALMLIAAAGCSVIGTEKSDTNGSFGAGQSTMMVEQPPNVDALASDEAAAPLDASRAAGDVSVDAKDRLIIRNKTMRIEVEKVADAISAIERLADAHDGIITAMQVATDNETPIYRYDEVSYSDGTALRGYITVRVPAEKYQAFLNGVSGVGVVLYQAENADDVTQQHVDMSARLENLRAEEARLREFFDAASKVEEMLSIERELSRVRGEIESLDAQVKYLERQAAMATVTIDLTEPKPLVRPSGDDWGFGQAVTEGFRGAAGVIKVAIALIIATAPLWILAVMVFLIVRAVLRRRARRHAVDASPAATIDVE